MLRKLIRSILKEHFDSTKFPEPMGLGFESKSYTYKGYTIDLVSINSAWGSVFDPPITINGVSSPTFAGGKILARTQQGALGLAKRLIDISEMSDEVQRAFRFVFYVADNFSDWMKVMTRNDLAREVETERGRGTIGFRDFYDLPINMRLKIIDEVIEIVNEMP